MKQQCPTGLTEGEIPKLIENHQIGISQTIGNSSLLCIDLFLFKHINEFNSGKESHASMVMLNRLYATSMPPSRSRNGVQARGWTGMSGRERNPPIMRR